MAVQTQSRTLLHNDLALPPRYKVIRRIANGGMASVWCADDAVLGRRVAIKLLAEQFVNDRRAVRRFQREARVAARLSGHPHVVTIFDVGQTEPEADSASGRPFIVMEHLPGGTVADAFQVGAVKREEALRWLREAASALDYAHGRGVVHRDIKPRNLLLDSARTLHVADFGIARIGGEDTITRTGQLFGTAAYLSPEQALGHPATEASDRYALAVAAYELLVGERPFTAEHFAAQARQHVEERPPRASQHNPALPAAVDSVLMRGMAKRPEERWTTASDLVDALEVALADGAAGAGVGAGAPPLVASGELRSRRLALAALASAAFGVGILAGAGSHSGTARHAVARAAAGARTVAQAKRAHPRPRHLALSSATTAAPSSASADALEAQGHQLLLDSNYGAAVNVLRRAVSAASPSSLTYAYALFDLGRSLRLSGDPAAAIPILRQRLQIPNQTDVVRRELELALQDAGAATQPTGGAGVAPAPKAAGKGHGHGGGDNGPPPGHGHGHGGGD